MKKERVINAKFFNVSYDLVNALLEQLLNHNLDIQPKDLKVFKMTEQFEYPGSVSVILTSKIYPEVKEGERAPTGIIDVEENEHGEVTKVAFK